jgi:hypothetical protein
MIKVHKKLTATQKVRGVLFSSCLSKYRTEQPGDTLQEVKKDDADIDARIMYLRDDAFFNDSPWIYNVIRE